MQFAMIAMAVTSAVSSIKQGEAQAQQLRFQANQSILQGQERSINYMREEINARRQAEAIMDRVGRANSAMIAKAAAQNIMPFEGSPLDLQKYNTTTGGRDWATAMENADSMDRASSRALAAGEMQAQQYRSAAGSARTAGWFSGLSNLAMAGYQYSRLGNAPMQQLPAPVTTANVRYLNG